MHSVVGGAAASSGGTAGTPTIWPFGVTTSAMSGAPGSSTLLTQSLSRFNWYPLNFYDDREGEVRDNTVADNSCSSNGLMNAVEIDVGNLKQWLLGNIGSSGPSVNSVTQNGYVLYFSDRRGMLPNPVLYGNSFTKSGDSGLEDDINSASAAGTPNGQLEPIPAGRTLSPEDINEDGFLDNFGADNMGLGFYGTVGTAGKNIWYQITTGGTIMANGTNGDAPDPFGTAANARIASCMTARKNWVSGARHALRWWMARSATYRWSRLERWPLQAGSRWHRRIPCTYGAITTPIRPTRPGTRRLWTRRDTRRQRSSPMRSPSYRTTGTTSSSVGIGTSSTEVTDFNNRVADTTYYRVAVAGGKEHQFPTAHRLGCRQRLRNRRRCAQLPALPGKLGWAKLQLQRIASESVLLNLRHRDLQMLYHRL